MSQTLYRFWSPDAELLYVGISARPWQRWREHRGEKPWWDEVASVTLEKFTTREEVTAAEAKAIRAEFPRYNIKGAEKAAHPEPDHAIDWSGVHAPEIACIGDLFWCGCNPPTWSTEPNHNDFFNPTTGHDDEAYHAARRSWVAAQPFYSPEDFSSHVIEAVLGEHFALHPFRAKHQN